MQLSRHYENQLVCFWVLANAQGLEWVAHVSAEVIDDEGRAKEHDEHRTEATHDVGDQDDPFRHYFVYLPALAGRSREKLERLILTVAFLLLVTHRGSGTPKSATPL